MHQNAFHEKLMGMHNLEVVALPMLAVEHMADHIEVAAENFVVVHIAEQVDSTAEQQVVRQVGSTEEQQELQQLSP